MNNNPRYGGTQINAAVRSYFDWIRARHSSSSTLLDTQITGAEAGLGKRMHQDIDPNNPDDEGFVPVTNKRGEY